MTPEEGSSRPRLPAYSELRRHTADAPLGELWVGQHGELLESRALKILRRELAGNEAFKTWYAAGLLVAWSLQEHLASPTLVAPIRDAEGKCLFADGETWRSERPWANGALSNIGEFMEAHLPDGGGLPEDVALSIISLVAEALRQMHRAKFSDQDGMSLEAIPHLNLKPENILIGRDKRSQQFLIRLTDFCIAMASPQAESCGVRASLNYASPELLFEKGYFAVGADIFSSGLVLYRLLEGEDFAPDLRRETLLKWYRDEFPGKLQGLKLKSASARTAQIIKRCLTPNRDKGYTRIEELRDDAVALLKGGNPHEILARFADRPKVKEPPRPKKPRETPPWLKSAWKPVAGVAGALAVVWVLWMGWGWYQEQSRRDELQTRVDAAASTIHRLASMDCEVIFPGGFGDSTVALQVQLDEVVELIEQKQYDRATEWVSEVEMRVASEERFAPYCETLPQILERGRGEYNRKKGSASARRTWRQLQRTYGDAQLAWRDRDWDRLQASYQSADDQAQELAMLSIPRPPGPKPPPDSQEVIPEVLTCAEEYDDAVLALDEFETAHAAPFDLATDYREVGRHLEAAKAALDDRNCDGVLFNAKSLLGYLALLKPCDELWEEIGAPSQFPSEFHVYLQESLDIPLEKEPERLLNSLRRCDCKRALEQWEELKSRQVPEDTAVIADKDTVPQPKPPPPPPPPPPEKVYTFQESMDLFREGRDMAALRAFRTVPSDDPNYRRAQKHIVLCKGRQGEYDEELQEAFFAAGSVIDPRADWKNAACYIYMACTYGWYRNRLDCNRAMEYLGKAQAMGVTVNEVDDWWKAQLIECRCTFAAWTSTPENVVLMSRTRDLCQSFIRSHRDDLKASDNFAYVEEVMGLVDSLKRRR